MSFSAEWLALREPVDHRSRNATLARALSAHFATRERIAIVDLGCGTGSNLRATAPLLPGHQEWLLVDYDAALLAVARQRLAAWADTATEDGGTLRLRKGKRALNVRFRQADLAGGVDAVVGEGVDLVTASALFDLISEDWIGRFAAAVARRRAAFFTVLTYDGTDAFAPAHRLDAAVIAAFARHQQQDKGFGVAAGPQGAAALKRQFTAVGYQVTEAASPWRIGAGDAALAGDLLRGIAAAVGETATVSAGDLDDWLAFRLSVLDRAEALLLTGHQDTLAVPTRA